MQKIETSKQQLFPPWATQTIFFNETRFKEKVKDTLEKLQCSTMNSKLLNASCLTTRKSISYSVSIPHPQLFSQNRVPSWEVSTFQYHTNQGMAISNSPAVFYIGGKANAAQNPCQSQSLVEHCKASSNAKNCQMHSLTFAGALHWRGNGVGKRKYYNKCREFAILSVHNDSHGKQFWKQSNYGRWTIASK